MGNKGTKRAKDLQPAGPLPSSENTSKGRNSSDGSIRVGADGDFFERARKEYMEELQQSPEYPNNLPQLQLTEILPFLYLGDIEDAADISKLQKHGITHIVNCCGVNQEMIASGVNDQTGSIYYQGSGINYMQIEAEDRDGYDMIQHFAQTTEWIDEGRKNGGKIFVHCVAGASRSPTIIAAYLLIKQGWDLDRIARHVIRLRHLACPRPYFAKQLEQFDAQIKESKDSSRQSPSSSNSNRSNNSSRGLSNRSNNSSRGLSSSSSSSSGGTRDSTSSTTSTITTTSTSSTSTSSTK